MTDNNQQTQQKPQAEEEQIDSGKSQIRELFILSALWLPMGFFLWFYFGDWLVRPTAWLSGWLLSTAMPNAIEGINQVRFNFEIETLIPHERLVQGRVALLTFDVNPMIYAYGVPLFFGLVMATPPLTAVRRAIQILIGYTILVLVQVWGVFWEALKDLALNFGALGAQAVAETGLPPTLIALCYQLGYLILPAVVPLVIWILLNRDFLQTIAMPDLTRRR